MLFRGGALHEELNIPPEARLRNKPVHVTRLALLCGRPQTNMLHGA